MHRIHALAALMILMGAISAFGQDDAPAIEEPAKKAAATTVENPDVTIESLRLLVKPMGADQLKVEAEAWYQLLQAKATEVSQAQLWTQAAKTDVENQADTPPAPVTESDPTEVAELRLQQGAIVERFEVVLASLEEKGGDVEAYRKYSAAVTRLSLDLVDADSFPKMIRRWIVSEEGGLRWAKNIGLFALALVGFWVLSWVVAGFTSRLVNRASGLSSLLKKFLVTTVRRVVLLLGFIASLSLLGVNVGPLMAAIGALGLVVGLALQGTLSNFASGLLILIYRPFDAGDAVTAGGVTGKVDSMSLVSTTLRTFDNQTIIIPNNEIWDNVITNITANATRRVDMTIGIGYSDDMAVAEQIILDVLNDHPLVLADPEPFVSVNELADSSVNYVVRPWAKTSDYFTVLCEVTRQVKERFDAAGVSIPFPQHDVHIHQVGGDSA